ncbi:MAG: hypothetical protein J4469_00365 [Candidatus Aenigmarchaeota archaeon]|nr:hypothetical protein [Candidatus Aenigmarchaeota archaeon]
MRVPVRFDHTDVKRYYDELSRQGSQAAREHQFECLRGPLSRAGMYLNFLIDDGKILEDPAYRTILPEAKKAIFETGISISYMQGNFPPEMDLCFQYVDAFHRFVDGLPDSLDFEGGKPFLRESDNSVHIANAMFSPEPAGAEVLLGLQEYHQGRHPVIFRMRDAHQQPSFSNDGCDIRKPLVIPVV